MLYKVPMEQNQRTSHMGKRATNAQLRKQAIIDAAMELLAAGQTAELRLEDVASRAKISPATLYKYFATKGELLAAIALSDILMVREAQREVIDGPLRSPFEMIMSMIEADVTPHNPIMKRSHWREVLASAICSGGFASEVTNPLHATAVEPFLLLLERLVRAGLIRSSTNVRHMAQVISCINQAHYLARLVEDENDDKVVMRRLSTNIEIIVDGIAISENGIIGTPYQEAKE
jgi:AcrR family transcriptional regulator